jgi:hypothetical protein
MRMPFAKGQMPFAKGQMPPFPLSLASLAINENKIGLLCKKKNIIFSQII